MNPYDHVSDATLDAYIAGAAALHGLAVAPEWQASVLANMRTVTAAAALLFADPLDDHVEAAPIFTP